MTRAEKRNLWIGLAFISPWIVGFFAFTLFPVCASVYFSFCDYDVLTKPVWIGTLNYSDMITDSVFWKSLYNTLYYAFFSLPICLVIALLVAVLLNQQGPMEKLCLGQRKFSPLVKVSDEFLKKHPNPYIKTFMDLAKSPDANYAPRMSVWAEYNDELNPAIDRVMALTATPQQALDVVQTRMQWKLDRVLRRWDAVKDERMKEWSNYDPR